MNGPLVILSLLFCCPLPSHCGETIVRDDVTAGDRDVSAPMTSWRQRRSDDTSPLAAVVSQLSRDLVSVQAQLTALTSRTAELESIVCFTARFSKADVTGLGKNQPVVFDVVENNAGGGYNKETGIFTAPKAGTYVFSLSLQRHASDESTIIMAIKKGTVTLGVAEAGYSPFEHGSMLVTAHVNQGDVISVQAVYGTIVYGGSSTSFSGFRISPS